MFFGFKRLIIGPVFFKKSIMLKNKQLYCIFIALFFIACFNAFWNLGQSPLASWDESRHGVSAVEMMESGNYLANTYNFEPDYFNSKPILSFMPMLAGFKLFGPSAFSLRVFSGVAFLVTFLSLGFFCYRRKGLAFAVLTSAVFVSSIRLITRHGARTGDADALFVMLFTLAVLITLCLNKNYFKYYLASFMAGLAFLTKSFHAGPLCLIIFIFYLMDYGLNKKMILHGIGCVFSALLPVAVWAAMRYQFDGTIFFEKILFRDLFDRYSEEIEGHNGGWYYYFIKILQNYPVWLGGFLVLLGTFLKLQKHKTRQQFYIEDKLLRRVGIVVLVPFVLLTSSSSKLDWYLYSTYPFIAILLAAGFFYLGQQILMHKPRLRKAIWALIVFCFVLSECIIIKNIAGLASKLDPSQEALKQIAAQNVKQPVYVFGEAKKKYWRQCLVLTAKIHGPQIHLMPGGKEAYDNSQLENKVLIYDEMKVPVFGPPEKPEM